MCKRYFVIIALAFLSFFMIEANEDGADTKNKESTKPYGCFKTLKWGMSKEEVIKELEIKSLVKIPLQKNLYGVKGPYKIGSKDYSVTLQIDEGGLNKVVIQVWGGAFDPRKNAQMWLDSYNELKPALISKYGPPSKQNEETRSKDVSFIEALYKHEAILMSQWNTNESTIILKVECTDYALKEKQVGIFDDILVYEKKKPDPKGKVDL